MMSSQVLARYVIDSRKRLMLTQAEAAELSEISLRTVRAIEAGKANPGLRQLNQLLDVVGLRLTITPKV